MKNLTKSTLVAFVSLLLLNCSKSEEQKSQLYKAQTNLNNEIIGRWVNVDNAKDTIAFNSDRFTRVNPESNLMDTCMAYTYKIASDSIKVQYAGCFKIFKNESNFHLAINKAEDGNTYLEIKNLFDYYPQIPGEKFKMVK